MTTSVASERERKFMARACELAARGQGLVEPNPMVGCVLVQGEQIVGEGWHERFGEPHAEALAIRRAGAAAAGATLYVTLEPCCHYGKTPPCSRAIIDAGIRRVVAAMRDPFPQVDGGGFAELVAANIKCDVGEGERDVRRLLAPYLKLVTRGRPWVLAKWAMSLDGKIATRTGDSQWITNPASRRLVHGLRGRVDAIMVGSRTARIDDPLLTARPNQPSHIRRRATRVVVDSRATLPTNSRLARSASEVPLLLAVSPQAPEDHCRRLSGTGAEIFRCNGDTHSLRLTSLLEELGRRRMTNVLVEGGGQLFGLLFDLRSVDEVHAFVAPKLIGGASAPGPLAGVGAAQVAEALDLVDVTTEFLDGDVHIHGRVATANGNSTAERLDVNG